MPLQQTTNILIQRSFLDGANFKESIDMALVCAAFDHVINLIFIDDGISNLLNNQSASLIDDKNHVDILKGLQFYDIDNIYFEQESLDKYDINELNLLSDVSARSRAELNSLNRTADHLLIL